MTTHAEIDARIKNAMNGKNDEESLRHVYAFAMQQLDQLNRCRIVYGDHYYLERAARLCTNAEVRGFNSGHALWAATAATMIEVLEHPNRPTE